MPAATISTLASALGFDDVSVASYLIAFVGGAISFLSPCVLPLAPGYVSIVSGFDLAELEVASGRRRRIVATTALFIAGFGSVFTLLGISASALGRLFFDHQLGLTRLSGGFMMAMALFMLGSLVLRAPWMYRELRFHPRLGGLGRLAPFVTGAAFGFGWSPCIGPTLSSVLGIATSQGQVFAGATLMMTYSLGLGVPFLALGLGFGRLASTVTWMRRHSRGVVIVSASVMFAFGLLLLTNNLVTLSARLTRLLDGTPLEWLIELG